jgi:hypothetical protein
MCVLVIYIIDLKGGAALKHRVKICCSVCVIVLSSFMCAVSGSLGVFLCWDVIRRVFCVCSCYVSFVVCLFMCLCVIVNYVLEFMYLYAVLLSVRASADGGLVVLMSWLFLYARCSCGAAVVSIANCVSGFCSPGCCSIIIIIKQAAQDTPDDGPVRARNM